MYSTVDMQWERHVQCRRHIYSGVHANNMNCIYISGSGHIVNCSEFMGTYTIIAALLLHMS